MKKYLINVSILLSTFYILTVCVALDFNVVNDFLFASDVISIYLRAVLLGAIFLWYMIPFIKPSYKRIKLYVSFLYTIIVLLGIVYIYLPPVAEHCGKVTYKSGPDSRDITVQFEWGLEDIHITEKCYNSTYVGENVCFERRGEKSNVMQWYDVLGMFCIFSIVMIFVFFLIDNT